MTSLLGPLRSVLMGLRAPLQAIVNPSQLYSKIGELSQRYGVYFTAVFYIGAWLGASIPTYFIVLMAMMARSILDIDVAGLAMSPLQAFIYSFTLPLVAAGLDSTLILIVAWISPRSRPLHTVFAIRASSLLPYTLRVVILAVHGNLSLASLMSTGHHPLGVAMLIAGFLLTSYGLTKGLGMPWRRSLLASALPLSYKLVLSLA